MADNIQMQRITDFYTQAVRREFSRDFLFRLTDFNMRTPAFRLDPTELVYLRAATLPARDIVNVEAKYMGQTFNIPGAAQYPGSDSYDLKFYCDEKSEIRNKFLDLSIQTFSTDTSTGDYGTPIADNYIVLAQLNKNLDIVASYKLVGVSIRNVGQIDYQMSDGTGTIVEFDAKVAYHFFETKQPRLGK